MSNITDDFSELTKKLIDKLLNACNKTEGVKAVKLNITLSRFSWYHHASTSDRLQTHQELQLLKSYCPEAFVITDVSQGFDAVPILESMEVINGQVFLKALGITPKTDILESNAQKATALLNTAPDWLALALDELPGQWIVGRTYEGLSPKHLDKLELAVKLVTWIKASGVDACDYRTASVQALGHSKILENNLHWIAKILSLKYPDRLSTLSDNDVLEEFGLSRWGSELKLRGGCLVHYPEGYMSVQCATPYVSLDITNIHAITCKVAPRYVLMIENLTTFKRYSQEVNDGGLVIYTGGFPSSGWVRLIKPLLTSLEQNIPVFHWGDIDIGGYRILAFLTQSLAIDIIPYCMSEVNTAVAGKVLSINDLKLALGTKLSGQLLKLSDYLDNVEKTGEVLRAVEQESIPIQSPLDNNVSMEE